MTPRRTPAFLRFILTGFVLGAVVGVIVAALASPAEGYNATAGPGYLILMLGGLGALLAALVAVILDLVLNRHTDRTNAGLGDTMTPTGESGPTVGQAPREPGGPNAPTVGH
ncbi:MAG: hypothetical protein ACK5MP_00655 [Nostocoides sp.]